MITMTDKELVEYLYEIANYYADYSNDEELENDMFYLLNRTLCVILNEDEIWAKDDICRIADSLEYWKQLVKDTIKEKQEAKKEEKGL